MCRFIGAFAVTIVKSRVPHKNFSFEAVKLYLYIKYRYSYFKIRVCCLITYNEKILIKSVKDTRHE